LTANQEVSKSVKQVINQFRQCQEVWKKQGIQVENISAGSIDNKEKVPSTIWITAGILGVGAIGALTYWIIKKRARGNK
jgi:hypothetical protein